jgi:hypothetical protein
MYFNMPDVPIKRKELGINNSTLWYFRPNLREGTQVKLNEKVKARIGK